MPAVSNATNFSNRVFEDDFDTKYWIFAWLIYSFPNSDQAALLDDGIPDEVRNGAVPGAGLNH
jgi:hypothetical protein